MGLILGKYQIFAVLGRGGMGEVYLSVVHGPKGFNKLVVLKQLRVPGASGDEAENFVRMFLDEARLAARLNHPNVVSTHEVGEEAGAHYIAMEYIEGRALNKVISARMRNGGRLSPGMSARIISDVLSGLHHAHELTDYDGKPLGIVHRDVSPHNIIVSYEGQAKLVDFGIAKARMSGQDTESGSLKGKIRYMAPEQAAGDVIDRRADIFAMGVVLWEALTAVRFNKAEADAAALNFVLHGSFPRASTIVKDLDPVLDDVVARSLARDPADRFQTALEMREALEEWMSSSGEMVNQEEVGRYLSVLAATVRAEVKQMIQQQMSKAAPEGVPVSLSAGPSSLTPKPAFLDLQSASTGVEEATPATRVAPSEPSTDPKAGSGGHTGGGLASDRGQPPAPTRMPRTFYLGLGVAVIAGAAYLSTKLTWRSSVAPPTETVSAAGASSATDASTPR